MCKGKSSLVSLVKLRGQTGGCSNITCWEELLLLLRVRGMELVKKTKL